MSSVESVTDRDSGSTRGNGEVKTVGSGTARPRLEVLDGLRFVAAMAVLAYHFTAMDRVWHQRADTVFPAPDRRLRLARCPPVLPDQRVRHLHEQLGTRGRRVPAVAGGPAVPGVLAVRRRDRAGADRLAVRPQARRVGQHAGQPHDVPGAGSGRAAVAEVYWTLWAELRFYLLFSLVVWWGLTYRRVVGFCVVWLGAVTAAKAFVPDGTRRAHGADDRLRAAVHRPGIAFYLMYRFRPDADDLGDRRRLVRAGRAGGAVPRRARGARR